MADRDRNEHYNQEGYSSGTYNQDYDRVYDYRGRNYSGSYDRDYEPGWPGSVHDRNYDSDWRGQYRGTYNPDYEYGRQGSHGMYDRDYNYNWQGRSGTYERDYDYKQYNKPVRIYSETWWRPGPYTGRGPRGYQRSDIRIREDVSDRLMLHGQIDASDIDVQVQNGEVTLTGTANNRQEKRMAEDTAEAVWGVREVHNQLRLKQPQQNKPDPLNL